MSNRSTEQRVPEGRLDTLIFMAEHGAKRFNRAAYNDVALALRELQRLRAEQSRNDWLNREAAQIGLSHEPRGEQVTGAADMLALFIEQLMNGPPNGLHMSLRDYLTQWRLVQGALDEYNEVRKGGAPKFVAATECRSCDQLMTERDNAEEQADKLAECIEGLLGIEIGEHTSGNEPWQNAIDAAEYELDKRKRAAPEPVGELGWLVEVAGGSGALWLKFSPASGGGWFRDWTDTASDALRFSRKDDAESYISAHMPCIGARATEHKWCAGPTAETKEGNV